MVARVQADIILKGGSISHGLWLAGNLLIAVGVAAMFRHDAAGIMLCVVAMASAWSIAMRVFLNKYRGLPWWYMGARLGERPRGASVYDTCFHLLSRLLFGALYNDHAPAMLAYAAEGLALTAATTMLVAW